MMRFFSGLIPADRHRQAGLTFIEIITVTAISLILISVFIRFVGLAYPISRTTFLQIYSTETARLQLKRIVRELREVRSSDTGAFPLVTILPQRIIFYGNVDGDALTERVRYELTGTNLVRGITKPSGNPLTYNTATEQVSTVASSVRNGATALFTYYNGDYPEDTTALTSSGIATVRYVELRLMIDVDPNQNPDVANIVSQVQLRNIKDNLSD